MNKQLIQEVLDDLPPQFCYGSYHVGNDYCAVGWIAHKMGIEPNQVTFVKRYIELKGGLDREQLDHIVQMNDSEPNPKHRVTLVKGYLIQLLRENA